MNIERLVYVPNFGTVYEARSNLKENLELFQNRNILPFSPRDEAYLRLSNNNADIGINIGTFTSMGIAYLAGEMPILTRISKIIEEKMIDDLIKENSKSNYLTCDASYYFKLKEDLKSEQGKEPENRNNFEFPYQRLFYTDWEKDESLLRFILGDMHERFMKDCDKTTLMIKNIAEKDMPKSRTILNLLFFGRKKANGFNCMYDRFDMPIIMRGVKY